MLLFRRSCRRGAYVRRRGAQSALSRRKPAGGARKVVAEAEQLGVGARNVAAQLQAIAPQFDGWLGHAASRVVDAPSSCP